jgi:hypothetical protein
MTAANVEKATGLLLSPQGQRPWGTHLMHDGTTDIWLQFDDNKLRTVQVATPDGLMRVKLWPKQNLCVQTSG